ncbi:MAG: hypothetical protein PHT12_00425 [Patescibacteria group bacterium]|nr:hypothetical protein [Patescibacteria group bacterium]
MKKDWEVAFYDWIIGWFIGIVLFPFMRHGRVIQLPKGQRDYTHSLEELAARSPKRAVPENRRNQWLTSSWRLPIWWRKYRIIFAETVQPDYMRGQTVECLYWSAHYSCWQKSWGQWPSTVGPDDVIIVPWW